MAYYLKFHDWSSELSWISKAESLKYVKFNVILSPVNYIMANTQRDDISYFLPYLFYLLIFRISI